MQYDAFLAQLGRAAGAMEAKCKVPPSELVQRHKEELATFIACWHAFCREICGAQAGPNTYKTLLLYDDRCEAHKVQAGHVESAERQVEAREALLAVIAADPLQSSAQGGGGGGGGGAADVAVNFVCRDKVTSAFFPLYNDETEKYRREVLRVHSLRHLDSIRGGCKKAGSTATGLSAPSSGRAPGEKDTWGNRDSWPAACAGFALALEAVEDVLRGHVKNAFVACRPPGHHAGRDGRPANSDGSVGLGFCLLNPVAGAAVHAVEVLGLQRVSVIDIDLHHGNGSEEILMGSTPVDGVHSNNRFQYISIHADDEFPYSGAATGDRDFPHLVNLPLPRTFDSIDHHDRWAKVEEAIEAFRPELILISAGYDAHAMDPIRLHMAKDGGTGGLTARDFHALVSTIKAKADKHCMGRLVAVMEGGYGTTSCCGGGGRGGSGRAKGKGK